MDILSTVNRLLGRDPLGDELANAMQDALRQVSPIEAEQTDTGRKLGRLRSEKIELEEKIAECRRRQREIGVTIDALEAAQRILEIGKEPLKGLLPGIGMRAAQAADAAPRRLEAAE